MMRRPRGDSIPERDRLRCAAGGERRTRNAFQRTGDWVDAQHIKATAGSLDSAMQAATAGLSKWLAQRYKLTDSEIATLLAQLPRP